MNDALSRLLATLHADGVERDAAEPDRLHRRRNLDPEIAALLALLIRAMKAQRIVEIGTSNGYSTLWFADAARATGGRVLSVDLDERAQQDAARNLAEADHAVPGLAGVVELRAMDGGGVLRDLPDGSVDLLFLDAERGEYVGWWPDVRRILRPGGLLAVDNLLAPAPAELAPFRDLVSADPGFTTAVVTAGKGELLALKQG